MAAIEANAIGQETIVAIIMNNDEPACDGGGDEDSHQAMMAVTHVDDDDDELFELDIDLLRGLDDDDVDGQEYGRGRHGAGGDGHALLANCLLPLSSVSKAVPVHMAASSSIMPSYYSGRNSSGRFFLTGGDSGSARRRRLGRAAADGGRSNSVRFWFSSRGFETMGSFPR